MPSVRGTALAVEIERRVREMRARLGGQLRDARKRRGWSQVELATRAGLDRNVVGRFERGESRVELASLLRIAVALGVPLRVDIGRDPLEEVADAGHLAMQELVLQHGRRAGFTVAFELPTRPNEPWRSIDVALGDPSRCVAIAVECWNTFGDIGGATRSSRRKLAELSATATGRWGPEGRAALAWLVRDTARNRAVVRRYPEVFATTFPGSSRAWVAALSSRGAVPDAPGLVWCDVRRRRLSAWRRELRGT